MNFLFTLSSYSLFPVVEGERINNKNLPLIFKNQDYSFPMYYLSSNITFETPKLTPKLMKPTLVRVIHQPITYTVINNEKSLRY